MVKVVKPKDWGKTGLLIQKSHDDGTYILVKDRKRADQVLRRANELGLRIHDPVTVHDYFSTNGFAGTYINNVLIDDADDVLKEVFKGVNIDLIAMREGDDG